MERDINRPESAPEPVFKLTPLMKKVQQNFALQGETLPGLIIRLHIEERRYPSEIRKTLEISRNCTLNWIRKFIPEDEQWYLQEKGKGHGETTRQLWQDPTHRAQRVANMKSVWTDPEKRKDMIEALHNPLSKASRAKSNSLYFKENPQEVQKIRKFIEKRHKEKRMRVLQEIVGENPKIILEHMAVAQGMPKTEIAKRLNISLRLVNRLLKDFYVIPKPGRTNPNFEILEDRRKIIEEAILNNNFSKLTKKEKRVLIHLYLLEERFPTQKEVAKDLKCSKMNISQNELRALRKLHQFV